MQFLSPHFTLFWSYLSGLNAFSVNCEFWADCIVVPSSFAKYFCTKWPTTGFFFVSHASLPQKGLSATRFFAGKQPQVRSVPLLSRGSEFFPKTGQTKSRRPLFGQSTIAVYHFLIPRRNSSPTYLNGIVIHTRHFLRFITLKHALSKHCKPENDSVLALAGAANKITWRWTAAFWENKTIAVCVCIQFTLLCGQYACK